MEIYRLKGKVMWERLKHNWTLTELANYFDVSEDEFLEYLEKTFSDKSYKKMKSRLDRNEKLKSKTSPNILVSKSDEQTETSHIETETLTIQIDKISNSICNMEVKYNELVAKRRSIQPQLKEEEKRLFSIKKELEERKKRVLSLISQLDTISLEMNEINTEISSSQELLKGLRDELNSLSKISIFAYENGEIEFEPNDSGIEIPDESNTFNTLLANESVEELPLRQIRQLAKLVSLANNLREKNREFEVTFENFNSQNLFEELISKTF